MQILREGVEFLFRVILVSDPTLSFGHLFLCLCSTLCLSSRPAFPTSGPVVVAYHLFLYVFNWPIKIVHTGTIIFYICMGT